MRRKEEISIYQRKRPCERHLKILLWLKLMLEIKWQEKEVKTGKSNNIFSAGGREARVEHYLMSSPSRKLHHPSMRMTIEERRALMKRFRNEKGNKKSSALLDDIFSCLHTKDLRRRSIGFFYFPEWLNICRDCRLSWDINIWRRVGINQETRSLGQIEGVLALNMYWLWIEVKCRDPGCRHDRGFSASNTPGFHHHEIL